MLTLGRAAEGQRMKYFHPHLPFPCLRQCTVTLKLYRSQMDTTVVLKSGQKPVLLFPCLPSLSHCYLSTSYRNRWCLQKAELKVCLCVYTCVQAHLKMAFFLYSPGSLSRKRGIIFLIHCNCIFPKNWIVKP